MATKATHISNPVLFHVSSTLLGRVKLQGITLDPTAPQAPPRPVAVRRPTLTHVVGVPRP